MMVQKNKILLRDAEKTDMAFILSLSPSLAEVAKLYWHKDDVVQKFQDEYILEMFADTREKHKSLIAEEAGVALGFIHVRENRDEISEEMRGTIPLLAVCEKAQGRGIGKLLMQAAEDWTKAQGLRLLHLEVFAANKHAKDFYQNLGFEPETIHMIKSLQ